MRFADPKSDIAFKKIFGNENKKEILISFLNAVLNFTGEKEIIDIEVLNPYQAPKIAELKETNLDVRAKNKKGITFIVEMQLEHQSFFAKRALYYTSKAYVGQIEKAANYPKLNQVIFIGIMDFEFFDGDHYMCRHLILDKDTYDQVITDFELNFIELPKFQKSEKELESTVDKWIYFLKHADDLQVIPKKLTEPKEIAEAFEVVKQHNWTKEELEYYESWEMRRASEINALRSAKMISEKKGIEKGIKKGLKKVAKKMLQENYTIENIMKITGLSRKDIEALKDS